MIPADPATALFLQLEQRKHDQRLTQAEGAIARADTMAELVRAYLPVKTAAHAILRAVVRHSPERQRVDLAAHRQGESLIDRALDRLGEFRRCPELQFRLMAGKFIEQFREPCRGDFPALYHKAERGLQEVKTWRHQKLKDPQDAVERPVRGADLQALGYVFHHTRGGALPAILAEGFTRGSFSRSPIDAGGDVWLAVHPRHLPPSQEHDYGGVVALEPNWDPEVTGKYDADMNWVTRSTERSVPADLLVVADRHGHVQGDGTLHAAMGPNAKRSARPR